MDSRNIWIVLSMSIIGTTCGTLEIRNINDCWKHGLKCSRWGQCNFDTSANNFTCRCVAGFKGDLCDEDRNECDIGFSPCKKRGICHNSVGSFRCDCVPGWRGSHCQTSDGSGLSTCPTGYTGLNCTDDFDECTQWIENPCEHNSTCKNIPGNFSCSCVTGWEGRICNEDINECDLTSGLCHNGGNCTNTPGAYKCVCPYPYTGPACDDISTTISTATSKSVTAKSALLHPSSIGWTGVKIMSTATNATSSMFLTKSSNFVKTSISGSNSSPATSIQSKPTYNIVATTRYFTTMTRHGTNGTASYNNQTTSSSHSSSTNSKTHQTVPECNNKGGVRNVVNFAGFLAGILVIAVAFGGGLVVIIYKIINRKSTRIDAGDKTTVETPTLHSANLRF